MVKQPWIKVLGVTLLAVSLLVSAACEKPNEKEEEIEWTDTVSRPVIDPLQDGKYIVYPEKPDTPPQAIDPETKPYVTGYTASDESGYTITEGEDGITISYDEVRNWSYVYVAVENYQPEYGNFKITAAGNGAERIAIQALYYEMYDLNQPAITVYRGDIALGTQYFIANLGEHSLLNASYNTISDSSVREETIIGFLLFIDSNPSQTPTSDKTGTLTITGFDFLDDSDPALKDRYVAPSVGVGFMDAGYSANRDEDGTIHLEREAGTAYWTKAYLSVANYSKDYTAFTLKMNTTGVKSYKIQLEINPEGHNWQTTVDMLTVTNVEDGVHEHYIDFTATQPISMLPPYDWVPGYFIKNCKITSILIYLDTYEEGNSPDFAASATISDLKFERTAIEGTQISRGWAPGSAYVTLGNDIQAGGVGTIQFSWHEDWYYLGMPVVNYEKSKQLKIVMEVADGLGNIGIALTANGFEYVLHTGWIQMRGNNTELEPMTGTIKGITETLTYDETNKIYTFVFDFSNGIKIDPYNIMLNEMEITLLRFYLNDPDESVNGDLAIDAYFEGKRTIRFISVEFIK